MWRLWCRSASGYCQDSCALSDSPVGSPSGAATPPAESRPGSASNGGTCGLLPPRAPGFLPHHYSLSRPSGRLFCIPPGPGNTIGDDPAGSLADRPGRPFRPASSEGPGGVAAGDGSPRQATDRDMPGAAPRLRNVVVAPADGGQPT